MSVFVQYITPAGCEAACQPWITDFGVRRSPLPLLYQAKTGKWVKRLQDWSSFSGVRERHRCECAGGLRLRELRTERHEQLLRMFKVFQSALWRPEAPCGHPV